MNFGPNAHIVEVAEVDTGGGYLISGDDDPNDGKTKSDPNHQHQKDDDHHYMVSVDTKIDPGPIVHKDHGY